VDKITAKAETCLKKTFLALGFRIRVTWLICVALLTSRVWLNHLRVLEGSDSQERLQSITRVSLTGPSCQGRHCSWKMIENPWNLSYSGVKISRGSSFGWRFVCRRLLPRPMFSSCSCHVLKVEKIAAGVPRLLGIGSRTYSWSKALRLHCIL
jgi:hypothetical protein